MNPTHLYLLIITALLLSNIFSLYFYSKQNRKIMKMENKEGRLHVTIKGLHDEAYKTLQRIKNLEESNVIHIQQLIGLGANPLDRSTVEVNNESSKTFH